MKFMVCYDGSGIAKKTLALAQKHAKVWNATLEIVKVITRSEPLKHEDVRRMEGEFGEEIKTVYSKSDIPYNCQLMLTEREAGEKIVEIAKDKNVDQIFLGVSKRSRVGKLIFGSSAQYTILNAPCPVVSIN